jgi:hypothetical protein
VSPLPWTLWESFLELERASLALTQELVERSAARSPFEMPRPGDRLDQVHEHVSAQALGVRALRAALNAALLDVADRELVQLLAHLSAARRVLGTDALALQVAHVVDLADDHRLELQLHSAR